VLAGQQARDAPGLHVFFLAALQAEVVEGDGNAATRRDGDVRRLLYVVGRSAPGANDVKAIDKRVREAAARHENSRFASERGCVVGNAAAVRSAHALRLEVEGQQKPAGT